MLCNFNHFIPDVPVCTVPVKGSNLEPERPAQTKPEVQVGLGLQNHEPRAQRTYMEELRREPFTEKYAHKIDGDNIH